MAPKINLGDAILYMTGNVSGLNKALGDAQTSTRRVFGNIQATVSKVGKSMTVAGAAMSAAFGVTIKRAADAAESENLFTVALGRNAEATRKWSQEQAKALGLNAYQVRENVAIMNQMLGSMGLNEGAALDMAKSMTILSEDMASFFNLRPEEAFQKLQAGISGETEPLKRLGILINETTIKTHALKTGMIQQGETMTEQQKVLARYQLIMEATANAQGDLGRTQDSTTNQLRRAQAQYQQLQITIGTALIPVVNQLLDRIMPLIPAMTEWVSKNKELVGGLGAASAAMAVGGPLLIAMNAFIGVAHTTFKAIGFVVKALQGQVTWLGRSTTALGANTAATTANAASVGALAGKLGLIAGTAAVGWKFGRWIDSMTENTAFGRWVDSIADAFARVANAIVNATRRLTDFLGLTDEKGQLGGADVTAQRARMREMIQQGMDPAEAARRASQESFAGGGVSRGGLAMVGERGPEIAALPAGTRVVSNQETAGMIGREVRKAIEGLGGGGVSFGPGAITIQTQDLKNMTDLELRQFFARMGRAARLAGA